MMENINVLLYGNTATTRGCAKITSCDRKDQCSFYKKGQCISVPRPLHGYCEFGNVDTIPGYTTRSKGAYAFEKKYKDDPLYRVLKRPDDWRIGLIGDVVVFQLVYASCEKKEWDDFNKRWKDSNVYLMNQERSTNTYSYIPVSELTPQVLYDIFTYEPKSIMDHKIIAAYTEKIVPHTLFDLSKLLPTVYDAFISAYPEYQNVVPDFRGRIAKVSTLVDGVDLKTNHGVFIKDGDYLVCDAYKPAFLAFGAKSCEARIKITDDMVYEITDNSQVDANTEFV